MEKDQSKKVLVVSYYFAPSGSTGGIRALKFVKYLRDFGWEPVVLTSKSGFDYNVSNDIGLLSQIPEGVKVIRIFSIEILNWFWLFKNKKKDNASNVDRVRAGFKESQRSKSVFSLIKQFIINVLSWPDKFLGWVPFAILRGLYVCHKEKVEVILVTNPPASSLLVGSFLSKITRKKFVVDYRDPWITGSKVNKSIEKKILCSAARIICTSPQIYKTYQSLYSGVFADKISIIYNGFDHQDLISDKESKEKSFEKLTFVHAGYLYSNEGVEAFLDATHNLVHDNGDLKDKISLIFIGTRPDLEKFSILEKDGVAKHINRIPRNECFKIVQKAHIALSFLPKKLAQAGCIPSKVFDSMLFKKPIISIMEEGAAQDLVREARIGEAILPGNMEQVKKTILKFYDLFQRDAFNNYFDDSRIAKFNRRNQTKELAMILDYVTK